MTIYELLKKGGGDAIALSSPGMSPITYDMLRDQVKNTGGQLSTLGVTPKDKVAIVLPNGPLMASAFLSVAAHATAAPLNPSYQAKEYEFYLDDLKPKVVLVEEGSENPVVGVAESMSIPVIALKANDVAGQFSLDGVDGGEATPASVEDIALVLHTSGTTSRPKIVPLSGKNITCSAQNIATTLALTSDDQCLNIMPLFHIHGLLAAVSSSIYAGATVCCTPGFNALKFFDWLENQKPTWVTAVPTMYQALLARGKRNADTAKNAKLRFLRSSSSSLPPQVMYDLEELFGCPVIESYGMTEAAHQMASNPLPPRAHKAGFVGLAAGPKVAILDAQGNEMPQGKLGEVCIQGDNVTKGYEANEKANAEAFTNGWFRTGDQGFLDEEGYLKITGRLKEIINRGGEKISPLEVDDVMMEHDAVQQAVTFARPDKMLGEKVAAAIVLKDGESLDEKGLKDFLKERLAKFKIPETVVFLDEIPKGATGKMQRLNLAEKLGLSK